MIEFARLIEEAFLPAVVLGLALGVAWRSVPVGQLRTALQWLASLLVFVPQPFVLFLGAYSVRLRLYQQVLLALWGVGTSALVVSRMPARERAAPTDLPRQRQFWGQTPEEIHNTQTVLGALRTRPQPPRRRVVLAAAALAMAVLGVWCAWNAVGDFLLTPHVVAGAVEGARVVRNTRSPNTYQLIIDGQAYNITRDLLAPLRPGEVVEADVGVASRTILAIRRDARPPQTGIPRYESSER